MTAPLRAIVTAPTFVASMALLIATPAHAGQVATSFEELRGLVTPGDTISITDAGGRTLKGVVAGISDSSLELRARGVRSAPPLDIAERDVNNIVVERHDPLWNGPLIGLIAGAVPGLLIELAARTQYEKFSGAGALGLGGIGVVTGLLIDILNKEAVVVYVHPPRHQSRKVRLSPLLSTSAAGMQMSVVF